MHQSTRGSAAWFCVMTLARNSCAYRIWFAFGSGRLDLWLFNQKRNGCYRHPSDSGLFLKRRIQPGRFRLPAEIQPPAGMLHLTACCAVFQTVNLFPYPRSADTVYELLHGIHTDHCHMSGTPLRLKYTDHGSMLDISTTKCLQSLYQH